MACLPSTLGDLWAGLPGKDFGLDPGWDLTGWDLPGWDLAGWELPGWGLPGWDLAGWELPGWGLGAGTDTLGATGGTCRLGPTGLDRRAVICRVGLPGVTSGRAFRAGWAGTAGLGPVARTCTAGTAEL